MFIAVLEMAVYCSVRERWHYTTDKHPTFGFNLALLAVCFTPSILIKTLKLAYVKDLFKANFVKYPFPNEEIVNWIFVDTMFFYPNPLFCPNSYGLTDLKIRPIIGWKVPPVNTMTSVSR